MQNYCKTIGALAAASALVAGNASAGTSAPAPVSAPDSAINYELHTGYTSQYLFRGVDLGNSLVEVGADVSTNWNGLGLSAGAWYGSFDGAGFNAFNASELDLYAEVTKDLGFATAGVGYIAYLNDDAPAFPVPGGLHLDDAQEVYFSLSRDFGFAAASFTYFWDLESDNDGYSELALSRSFDLGSCLKLNVSSNVSFLFEEAEFGAWTTKVAVDWAFAEHAKLSPFVALAVGIDDGNIYNSDNDNELVGGSILSVSF